MNKALYSAIPSSATTTQWEGGEPTEDRDDDSVTSEIRLAREAEDLTFEQMLGDDKAAKLKKELDELQAMQEIEEK